MQCFKELEPFSLPSVEKSGPRFFKKTAYGELIAPVAYYQAMAGFDQCKLVMHFKELCVMPSTKVAPDKGKNGLDDWIVSKKKNVEVGFHNSLLLYPKVEDSKMFFLAKLKKLEQFLKDDKVKMFRLPANNIRMQKLSN